MKYKNIGFVSSKVKDVSKEEQFLLARSCKKIESVADIKKYKIDLLFVLGGDGFMLRVLHKFLNCNLDFYGINCGTHGFLLNNSKFLYDLDIEEMINNSKSYQINPLKAKIIDTTGKEKTLYAINEITLLRNTHNAGHIKITIDDKERMENLIGDGVIVATPAGSTAYNLSLNGPILPLSSNFLAITPISPFKPRLWRGAIIKNTSKIRFDVLDCNTRIVNTMADFMEAKNSSIIEISLDFTKKINLLFNVFENIDEKIMKQQFYS